MKDNRGQSLVGVLVTGTILLSMMLAFVEMFRMQTKTAQNIAGEGGATNLSHALDLLFGSTGCTNIGTQNYSNGGHSPVQIVQTLVPAPGSYSVAIDTLGFSNGSPAITSVANDPIMLAMIQPYRIQSMTLTPTSDLTRAGGATATLYPFHLKVVFTTPKPDRPPPPAIDKYIMIYTLPPPNNTTVVGACSAGSGSYSLVNIANLFVSSTATPGQSGMALVTVLPSPPCYTGGADCVITSPGRWIPFPNSKTLSAQGNLWNLSMVGDIAGSNSAPGNALATCGWIGVQIDDITMGQPLVAAAQNPIGYSCSGAGQAHVSNFLTLNNITVGHQYKFTPYLSLNNFAAGPWPAYTPVAGSTGASIQVSEYLH